MIPERLLGPEEGDLANVATPLTRRELPLLLLLGAECQSQRIGFGGEGQGRGSRGKGGGERWWVRGRWRRADTGVGGGAQGLQPVGVGDGKMRRYRPVYSSIDPFGARKWKTDETLLLLSLYCCSYCC